MLPAPVVAIVSTPECAAGDASAVASTLIEISRLPLPEAGLTDSQGWLVVTVHDTGAPLPCVSRSVCAVVCDVSCAPLSVAP